MPEATRQQQAEDKVLALFGGKPASAQDADDTGDGDDADAQANSAANARGEPQAGAQDTAQQGEAQGAEAGGQESSAQQPEEVEVEIDGERYLMPKRIADKFIHHADYSRKTMDLAEMRRATAGEREVLMIEKAFDQTVAVERQHLAMLDAQIAQYRRVDWQALDTDQLLKARATLDELKQQRAEIDASVKAKREGFDKKLEGVTAEVKAAGQKYIDSKIPQFDDAKKASLFAYGLREGYTRDEMEKLLDPRLVVSLWKAEQWDKLQASKPGITKKAQQSAPAVRPGASSSRLSRVQQLGQAVKTAKTPEAKKQATEAYFTAKFGG